MCKCARISASNRIGRAPVVRGTRPACSAIDGIRETISARRNRFSALRCEAERPSYGLGTCRTPRDCVKRSIVARGTLPAFSAISRVGEISNLASEFSGLRRRCECFADRLPASVRAVDWRCIADIARGTAPAFTIVSRIVERSIIAIRAWRLADFYRRRSNHRTSPLQPGARHDDRTYQRPGDRRRCCRRQSRDHEWCRARGNDWR